MQFSAKSSSRLSRTPRLGPSHARFLTWALLLAATSAKAQDAGKADASSTDLDDGAGVLATDLAPPADDTAEKRVWASCLEHIPKGATRPVLEESFPTRGLSGYALPLEITVEHGRGETVLPQGFRVQSGSDAARALAETGFALPEASEESGPRKSTVDVGERSKTSLTIPFVALPKEPSRKTMTLPPVPIAIARASGEIVTACTQPHVILIEDPTASIPDAKPRPNPEPRSQIEEFTLAKQLTLGALIGALLAIIGVWLARRWMARPKPVPPPPPPRPPWEVALEELTAIRQAALPEQGLHSEHFDRISDAMRKYLGGRYGFDGLESTTDEISWRLRNVQPPILELGAILHILSDCDLVKFARVSPNDEQCERILELGERIVWETTPAAAKSAPKEALG